MRRVFGVTCPIKAAIRLIQAAFQHIEHIRVIGCAFVPIAVFKACAHYPVNVAHIISAQAKNLFPENFRCVVAAYVAYYSIPEKFLQRGYNIAL